MARRFLGEDAEGNLHRLRGVRGGHGRASWRLIGDSQITGPLPATRQSDRPSAFSGGGKRQRNNRRKRSYKGTEGPPSNVILNPAGHCHPAQCLRML